MKDWKNKRVTVLGLGRFGGGIAVARWLCQQGAKVLVTDRDDAQKLSDSVRQLQGLPVEFRLGIDQQCVHDFTDTDCVVTSPAVKPDHEFLLAARDRGVPVTTEIYLFVQRCPAPVIGVTGTKGKSTTSRLIAEMLQPHFPTFLGGNIGKSLLFDLPRITEASKVVLELSSFMLHYLGEQAWSPLRAVVTMLGQDHLDWHGSEQAYIDAKRNISRYQHPGSTLIRRTDPVSASFPVNPGVTVLSYPDPTLPRFELSLPGEHNQQNAQAAFLASGLDFESAQRAIRQFRGLPHRLELVHESNGVRFYNDSIATIPQAAMIACDSFEPQTVIQIIGGARKEGLNWDAMCQHLAQRCKRVLTIGQIGEDLARKCPNAEFVQTLEQAVSKAVELARPGDVILLSPGTSSYDQFPNFEYRGQRFSELVRNRV
ncbi:MAG: UDP-N-acetylmuramoylalanine--D-glutamate ligase [Phycisphaerae bacterium]|jgi:UDP-N-acetylmuramoylalanine--D-glutamate ligase|nr:MAG: UDP-N-acetylmuramoylalanine--D-glutamate ligase [Phycisphaerae bacterium]